MWKKIDSETSKSWLTLREPCPETDKDYYWWQADVRFDGCVHLWHAGNVPFEAHYGDAGKTRDKGACDDYTHICDIDDLIRRLEALKAEAIKHFGERWPD